MKIHETDDGGTILVGYGHAVYALRTAEGFIGVCRVGQQFKHPKSSRIAHNEVPLLNSRTDYGEKRGCHSQWYWHR